MKQMAYTHSVKKRKISRMLRYLSHGALYLAITGGLLLLLIQGGVNSGYTWQWDRVLPYFITPSPESFFPVQLGPLLVSGLGTTLLICVWALLLALLGGLTTAILRLAGGPISKNFALGYVQILRNTPLMVQLLAVYYFVPASWELSATVIAIIVLGMFEGAYMAEVFRAGILAVPQGQWEAAASLGLPNWVIWQKVILPQALRNITPPIVSQCVSLIKDSALVSVIAVNDLAQQSGLIISDTFLTFEIWLPVAGIYLSIALLLSALAAFLQQKGSKGCPQTHCSATSL